MCLRQVLNEVVVDRGPSSYLSNVDLYLDGRLITSVQGDGECSQMTPSPLVFQTHMDKQMHFKRLEYSKTTTTQIHIPGQVDQVQV